MRPFVCAALAALVLAGSVARAETPSVNPPRGIRTDNYAGGSCSYASVITLLRWQGQTELADWMRRNYANGTWCEFLDSQLEKAGVSFVSTWGKKDVALLEWACRTRRGACIGIYGDGTGDPHHVLHMVNLVHLDAKYAGILDNNQTHRIIWMNRQVFVEYWIGCGSWAVVPVYSPAPPLPTR